MADTNEDGASTEAPADDFSVEPYIERLQPPDPAIIVAKEMLRRALTILEGCTVPIGSPGSLATVCTPSGDWNAAARDAWKSLVHQGEDGADADRDNYRHFAWCWFIREDDKSSGVRRSRDETDDLVAKALYKGIAQVGFSSNPDGTLPRDLVSGADHRVVLSPPTAAVMHDAVCILTRTEPTFLLGDDEASLLTPRLLRLASRPNQQADDYLRKLRDLIAAEKSALSETRKEKTDSSMRGAPTLDRLHGMDEAVAWGFTLRDNLEAFNEGRIAWSDVDTIGCLLSGPPGCGKTLFARALAATCNVPLVSGSYSEWLGTGTGHQGDLLRAMRKTFADAKAKSPSILFIDEVDSFPNRAAMRHVHADWIIQVVNGLLAEIDGVGGRDGVVLIAACNHPHLLDPALVRSGRLDQHISIRLPDQAALELILREHLEGELADESMAHAALLAAGATGADCERLVRYARRRAREAKRPMVLTDLIAEIGGHRDLSPDELLRVAVHEAGHALAICENYPGTLRAVTLRSSGDTGGAAMSEFSDAHLLPDDVRKRVMCLLGGRAAEEVVFGIASAGSGGTRDSDLAQATKMVAMAIASYGFDEVKGLVWSGVPDHVALPDMLAADGLLAERVRTMLADAYDDALSLMRQRRPALEALTNALLKKSALDGAEAERLAARLGGRA